MTPHSYLVNEIFLAPQGEGIRAGTLNVFLRLSKCNMRCAMEPGEKSPGGFDCDTEFESGIRMTAEQIVEELLRLWPAVPAPGGSRRLLGEPWVIVTGGEPALQLDVALCDALHAMGFLIAVETNGSLLLPTTTTGAHGWSIERRWEDVQENLGKSPDAVEMMLREFAVDWITVSPKVAEHAVRQLWAHELRYVRGRGQGVPQPAALALHRLISPAFNGLDVDAGAVDWCLRLVRESPDWRLSAQLHKVWGSR